MSVACGWSSGARRRWPVRGSARQNSARRRRCAHASANRQPELGLSSAESSAAPRTEGGEESMKQGVPRLSCPWQTSGVRPAFLQAFCPCPTPAPVASPFLFGRGKTTCCERSTRKWQFKQFQIVKPYLHHSDTTCPVSGARA